MTSVQQVGKVIEKVYEADGLTIACQESPISEDRHTFACAH